MSNISNWESSAPLVIAHRGASAYAPENTIAAFRRAVEVGADAIELDARLSKDGVVLAMHDDTIDRTMTIRSIGRRMGKDVLEITHLMSLKISMLGRVFPPHSQVKEFLLWSESFRSLEEQS
jgi:glycerophosphoryl diester phosphodiesterase